MYSKNPPKTNITILLLKYIHDDLTYSPEVHPGYLPDVTKLRYKQTFIPEDPQKIFGLQKFCNYYYITEYPQNGNITISFQLPTTSGGFATIQKNQKGKMTIHPTKYQHAHQMT